MIPTRLTVWLFALGLIPLLAGACLAIVAGYESALARSLPVAVVAFDAGLFILVLFDVWFAKRRRPIRVSRELSARLSVGVANDVALLIENPGSRTTLMVRDETPTLFAVQPDQFRITIPSHGWLRLTYQVTPTQRGEFAFGDIHVRQRGPLGLAWVDRALPSRQTTQVYPNLQDVRRYEALFRTSLVRTGGSHIKRIRGTSKEFSHYRDYQIDDDYRSISWKATARRAKPISTIYESEHSQDIIFCLDIGRMMAAKVGRLTKLDHAINAVLMLTHVSHRFHDNLGLLVFSHQVHQYLPPSKGRSQYAQFLQALYKVQPDNGYVNYREAFQHLIARHPKRALTMVFTDLLDHDASADYRDAMQLLRRFHWPLTLAVADVPLQNLAATTPETVEQLYDVAVARNLLSGRREMLSGLEREGVMVVDTAPERLTIDAVNQYLAIKTQI